MTVFARAAALPARRKQRMHQSHKTTKMPCSSSFVGIQAASAEVQQMQRRRSKGSKEPSLAKVIWGFPKIGGTFLGVPIIRTIVFWGLYLGPSILGNYHLAGGGKGRNSAQVATKSAQEKPPGPTLKREGQEGHFSVCVASWPGQPSAEQHPHLHSVSKEPERQPTAKILQARWAACTAEAETRDMSDGICLKGDSGLVRARAGKDAQ